MILSFISKSVWRVFHSWLDIFSRNYLMHRLNRKLYRPLLHLSDLILYFIGKNWKNFENSKFNEFFYYWNNFVFNILNIILLIRLSFSKDFFTEILLCFIGSTCTVGSHWTQFWNLLFWIILLNFRVTSNQ